MSDATVHPISCNAPHPELQVTCSRMRGHRGSHIGSNGQDHGVSWVDEPAITLPPPWPYACGYHATMDEKQRGRECPDCAPAVELEGEPDTEDGGSVGEWITGPTPDLARVYGNLRTLTALLIVLVLIAGPGLVILIYRAAL